MDAVIPVCLNVQRIDSSGGLGVGAGMYVYADVSGGRPLDRAFDAICDRLIRADAESTTPFGPNLVWAVVLFGIERGEVDRAWAAQERWNELWDRPRLWDRLSRNETVFGFWLVDGEGKPFHAFLHECPGTEKYTLAGDDVRETPLYRGMAGAAKFRPTMTAGAVDPATLSAAREVLRTRFPAVS